MNDTLEFFKHASAEPEKLFSDDNPVYRMAGRAHRDLYEALDGVMRANLALTTDLLDINRQRIEALYAGKPLSEQFQSQADILFESGKRVVAWSDELRDVATTWRSHVADLADEAAQPAPAAKAGRKTAKAA